MDMSDKTYEEVLLGLIREMEKTNEDLEGIFRRSLSSNEDLFEIMEDKIIILKRSIEYRYRVFYSMNKFEQKKDFWVALMKKNEQMIKEVGESKDLAENSRELKIRRAQLQEYFEKEK